MRPVQHRALVRCNVYNNWSPLCQALLVVKCVTICRYVILVCYQTLEHLNLLPFAGWEMSTNQEAIWEFAGVLEHLQYECLFCTSEIINM